MKRILLASISLLALAGSDAGAMSSGRRAVLFAPRYGTVPDFYVATTGSDSNSCRTVAAPCLTIAGAQTKLRAVLTGAGQNRPWIVQVGGGTYELATPLVFSAADSGGSSVNRVTWQAAPGATPVISGGRDLGTSWTNNAGIWEITHANLQSGVWNPRNFWVNDERRIRPRAPARGSTFALANYGSVGNAPSNRLNQFVWAGSDVNGSMANPLDAEILVHAVWSAHRLKFAGINAGSKTITTTGWLSGDRTVDHVYGGVPDSPTAGSRYFIDNVSENLSSQLGSFYIDRTPSAGSFTGKVRYNPKVGETINTMRMVIPVMDDLMYVSNRNDGTAVVKNITFKGLTFAHTDHRAPTNGSYGDQAGMAERSAISVAGATDIVFDGVTIRNTGAGGITFSYGCTRCKIINSNVYDTGGVGVYTSKYIPGKTTGSVNLVDNHGHNLIPNPSFVGASGASPGAKWFPLPTTNGISLSFQTGHENGIPYLDVTPSGTNTLGADFDVYVKTSSPYPPAIPGEELFIEGYMKLASGNTNGIAYADFQVQELNNTTFLQTQTFPANLQKSAATLTSEAAGALNTRYMFATMTVANASTNSVSGVMRLRVLNGANFTTNPITIRFGGFRIRSNRFWKLALGSDTGPQEISDITIANNYVQGVGRSNPASAPITVNNAVGANVYNNRVDDSYGPGLELGYVVAGGTCNAGPPVTYTPNPSPITQGLYVARNYISNIGQGVTSDLAGIYIANNSPSANIVENVIYNVTGYEATSPQSAFYTDEGASNITFTRNTAHTIGGPAMFSHWGNVNMTFDNNILVNPGFNIPSGLWTGAVYSNNGKYMCNVTNANTSITRNVAKYTQTASDYPNPYGNNNNLFDMSTFTLTNNRYEVSGTVTQAMQFRSWANWTGGDGKDAGSVLGSLGLTGSAPFVYPANKPSGWVDFDQNLAGLSDKGRALPAAVPATFP
jgi:hypothetical protein